MLDSTPRPLRNLALAVDPQVYSNKKRLVGHRAQATKLASHRVDELKCLFGHQLKCYPAILFRESVYCMAKAQRLVITREIRWTAFLLSFVYGILALALFWCLLLYRLKVWIFAEKPEPNSMVTAPLFFVVAFLVLAVFAAWLTKRSTGRFSAEFHGRGDQIKSNNLRRELFLEAILYGFYFFFYGIAFSPSSVDSLWDALLPLGMGSFGAVGMSVSFSTWLCVILMGYVNRTNANYLSIRFPVETILHELTSCARLLRGANASRLSFRKQRIWHERIELAARTVERGLCNQLVTRDRISSSHIAARLSDIANGIRDLKIWLATPKPDTYPHLERRLLSIINDVAEGSFDHLPTSCSPSQKHSLWKDAIKVIIVLLLAVGLSFSFAMLAVAVSKSNNVLIPSFGVVFPLASSYLLGLAMPKLSPRGLPNT